MSKGFTHESQKIVSVEWYTPKSIFDALGVEFDLDPCSPGKDIVSWIPAKKHYTVADNGLMANWEGSVWLNPPYGRDTGKWLERLALHGNGIALVFCRPDTIWFHRNVVKATCLCLMKGRVSFISEKDACAYAKSNENKLGRPSAPSMLIAYGEDMAKAVLNSNLGLTLTI